MVDIAMLGVGVLDRLIQLLTVDRRNREKYFEQFIEPLYKDAESVMNDYVGLFTELIGLLKKTDSTEEVIEWIEQRRSKMLPMRIKVRALLDNNTVNPKKGDYLLDSTTDKCYILRHGEQGHAGNDARTKEPARGHYLLCKPGQLH